MADIEVLENTGSTRVVATVNGQNAFDFDFLAYTADSLVVVFMPVAGPDATLDLGVDFTVSGLGQPNGGSITFIGAYAGVSLIDDEVLIYRSTPIKRLFDYQNAGDFRADVVNRELDTMIMIDQEARRDIDRSPKVPIGTAPVAVFPGSDEVAAFDENGNLMGGGLTLAELTSLIGLQAGRALIHGVGGADPFDAVGRKISNLVAGAAASDAVNKGQLDLVSASIVALIDSLGDLSLLDQVGLANISAAALADLRKVSTAGQRTALLYNGALSVRIPAYEVVMGGGFRYRGAMQHARGRVLPASGNVFDLATMLAGLNVRRNENWYACFWCANAADAVAVPRLVPYHRIRARTGGTGILSLMGSGEGIHTGGGSPVTYDYNSDVLAGRECLVISENGGWSGRIDTIVSNSQTSITISNGGSIGNSSDALDWILPAPAGFDEFTWAGDFYLDTAEVRNIYDDGHNLKGKNIFVLEPAAHRTGSRPGPPGDLINVGGYISPLATGVRLDAQSLFSTASGGTFAEYFDGDGANHILQSTYSTKTISTSDSIVHDGIDVNYLYHQRFNYYNAGSLAASRSGGQLNITGYRVP